MSRDDPEIMLHSGFMAVRGHVSPDRNRNNTEVNTNTGKQLYALISSLERTCPRNIDASSIGAMKKQVVGSGADVGQAEHHRYVVQDIYGKRHVDGKYRKCPTED